MFDKNFNHECSNLIEACGFKREYFYSLLKSLSKIYDNSIKSSFFIEATENQILGDEKVSFNVRRGIRLLLILIVTSKNLSDLPIKKIIIKNPKGLANGDIDDILRIIAEASDEGIPPQEIERILEKKFDKIIGKTKEKSKKKSTSKSKDKKDT